MATESQGDDRGRAPVLDRPRPVPRPQRLALQPQPAAAAAAARGDRASRPRTTPRSPPASSTWRLREGDTLQAALERCLDDLDGFYTFAVGTADGFAVLRDPIACKPAVMAETDDVGGDGVRVPRDRRAARAPRTPACGSPSRRASTSGSERRCAWRSPTAVETVDLASTPLRELNARLHAAGRPAPRWRGAQPERRARRRGRARRRRRGRRRRPRRLLLRRHEQARDRARARQRGRRRGREHHVRPRRGRRLRRPVVRRHRPRRAGRRARRRVGALRDLDEGRRHRRRAARSGT